MKRPLILLGVIVLIAGCDTATETTTSTAVPATTRPSATTQAPATTQALATTTPATATTATSLPGEPIEIGPGDGDRVAVVGVGFDDVLNLRAAPGADQEILAELDPTYGDMIALGQARQLPQSIWFLVEANGVPGWVSSRFVGYIGATDDITSFVVSEVGEIPSAETMLDMADIVAATLASEEPPSRITVTRAPTVGDLGEVTIDIVGLGDDAQLGWRLVIFAQPVEGGGGFSLMAVEATALCGRGVTAAGLCV